LDASTASIHRFLGFQLLSWRTKIDDDQVLLAQVQAQEIGRYVRIFNPQSWISVICQIFVNNHLSVSRQKSTFWGEIM
jgi:hypothetical protein